MFADTDAIRALGSANSAHAADLSAVAAALSSLPVASMALGPVGARFVSALAEATAEGSRAVTALADRLSASHATAYAAAALYEKADDGAGSRVAGI
jgi:hypothetical protein